MKNKKFIIILFLIISLGLIYFLWDFNNEMILTKKNIELINQDKKLELVFNMPNMFDIYIRAISESVLKLLIFISPLLVTIPALKNFYKVYKTGMIKSIVNTRERYDLYIKKQIIKSYKYAFILPATFIYIIIIIGLYSKFSLTKPMLFSNMTYFNSNIIFIVLTSFNLLLCGIFYINLGLIIINHFKNIYLFNIFIYILFLLIAIFSELILGMCLYLITNIDFFGNIFSFFNIWFNGDCGNNLFVTIFLLIINMICIIFIKKKFDIEENIILNV